MPSNVTRDEFRRLATRIDVLEHEVQDKRMMKRQILEQVCHNGDHLAAMKVQLHGVEGKIDGLAAKIGGLHQKIGGLGAKLDGLIENLPHIIGGAVRQAFREERECKS